MLPPSFASCLLAGRRRWSMAWLGNSQHDFSFDVRRLCLPEVLWAVRCIRSSKRLAPSVHAGGSTSRFFSFVCMHCAGLCLLQPSSALVGTCCTSHTWRALAAKSPRLSLTQTHTRAPRFSFQLVASTFQADVSPFGKMPHSFGKSFGQGRLILKKECQFGGPQCRRSAAMKPRMTATRMWDLLSSGREASLLGERLELKGRDQA